MRKEKGITLIALIITIIIMLILAGVVITLTIGENGLFKIAKQAGKDYKISAIKEQIITDVYDKQAQNEGDISEDNLKEILERYGKLSEEENLMDKTLTTTKGNYKIKVSDIFYGTTIKDGLQNPEGSGEGSVVADKSGANVPNVSKIAQKTYATWNLNEEGTEYVINDTQTTPPTDWYDYDDGKWANIKTSQNELEAYWVWIPRYEYIVPTSETSTEIELKFIPTSKTIPDEGYIIHPAFTNEGNGGFGELDGIWVSKFEASSNTETPDTNYGGGNDTSLKVQVKSGVQSWRNIETKNIFSVCRKMTSLEEVLAGSTVDSHMMKNTEWGAVAILSQSKYGVYNPQSSTGEKQGVGDSTKKVWNNPYGYGANSRTGYVGDCADASTAYGSTIAPTNVIEYNKKNTNGLDGTKASTTGTVYGVYDMAGGSWEYVAGIMKGDSTDGSKDLEYATSKFNITNQGKPEGMTDLNFAKKYLDLYNYRIDAHDYSQCVIGDATVETKGWNGDYSNFPCSSTPVLIRGRELLKWHECRCFCLQPQHGGCFAWMQFPSCISTIDIFALELGEN